MTEIPEHLLKRSQSAKAKATGAPAPSDAPGAAPATTASAAPATVPAAAKPAKAVAPEPPKAKPDPPYIAAAKSRKKIPFWAMATLSILPLWLFMYARALTPVAKEVAGPLGAGAAVYSANCSGCHGGAGEGVAGSGYQFSAGEVLKTFPHIEDQLRWVYAGTQGYQAAGIALYGNPDRAGGPHLTGARGIMPAQGAAYGGGLSEAEILAVVCDERYTLGGADPLGEYQAEYDTWCSPESTIYTGLEAGTLTFDSLAASVEGTFPVGTKPAEGHAADAQP